MNWLKSFGSYFWGSPSKPTPSPIRGSFYVFERNDWKCTINTAIAEIKKDGKGTYSLHIVREYMEGEERENEEDDFFSFQIDSSLQIKTDKGLREMKAFTIIYKNMKYSFEFDQENQSTSIFMLNLSQCLYEKRFEKSSSEATAEMLDEVIRSPSSTPKSPTPTSTPSKASPSKQSSSQPSTPLSSNKFSAPIELSDDDDDDEITQSTQIPLPAMTVVDWETRVASAIRSGYFYEVKRLVLSPGSKLSDSDKLLRIASSFTSIQSSYSRETNMETSIGKELDMLSGNKWTDAYKYYKAHSSKEYFIYAKTLCLLKLQEKTASELFTDLQIYEESEKKVSLSYLGLKHYVKSVLKLEMGDNFNAAIFAIAYLICPIDNYPKEWVNWAENVAKSCSSQIADMISGKIPTASPSPSRNSTPVSSPSQKQSAKEMWQVKKSKQRASSSAIDKLMELTGLEEVKMAFLNVYEVIMLDKERNLDYKKKRYNLRLEGNPGTGKTTVAKLYGKLLLELGVIQSSSVIETTGAKLIDEGVSGIKSLLNSGGMLFIDEAYQLDPANDKTGKQVLNYLLEVMETKIGELVVAVAGYKKDMEKLFEFNSGLSSRFPHLFRFADYNDSELTSIFEGLIANHKFTYGDKKYIRIAIGRLTRMRGVEGFGNARSVQNLFDKVHARQGSRITRERNKGNNPNAFMLEREDLLGPSVNEVEATSAAWKELESMVGLEKVKQSIRNFFELVKTNVALEEQEKPLRAVTLNRLFLGNPGTGKTTVANLYASILAELGLLSKGEVVFKTASDFVGSYIGQSEEKTRKILENSIGCVLVIDEAYSLYSDRGIGNESDPFKVGVINTIVEKVQNVPGEDRCVIMLGYKEDMQRMLRNSNPGLARRFQMEDAFEFEDYTNEQLLLILKQKLKKAGLTADLDTQISAIDVLAKQRNLPNFGNGGAVANLLSKAIIKMQEREQKLSPSQRTSKLIESDFVDKIADENEKTLFGDLIGCDEIIQTLKEYEATILTARAKGRDAIADGILELNFRFVGAPGTGKTTVASRMGKMFQKLGVLSYPEVVSKSASDFQTGYVGQAGKVTRKIVEQALGRVLFIDEAYRLNPRVGGSFMQEALDELVQLLTEPKFRGKLVVILAGYEADMNKLMNVNEGLRSRFSKVLKFKNLSVKDATFLMRKELAKLELTLSTEASQILPDLVKILVERPGFANGRDITTWGTRVFRQYALRLQRTSTNNNNVISDDLKSSLRLLLEDTEAKQVNEEPRMKQAFQFDNSEPISSPSSSSKAAEDANKPNTPQKKQSLSPQLTPEELKVMNQVANDLQILGTDDEPDRLLRLLINADLNAPYARAFVEGVAAKLGNGDIKAAEEKVKKMQEITKSKLREITEQNEEAKKKRLREVWKCAACGRFVPQCTFSPYKAYTEEI